MAKDKKIMGWSGCKVEVGTTGENDTMPTQMTDIGVVKQNTTSISTSEGDTLESKDSFGNSVAREQQEGTVDITTTVIEPSADLFKALGVADAAAEDGSFNVKTLVVPGDIALRITPKNKGAKGIEAPVTRVTLSPAFGNDTGHELQLTFRVSKTADGILYKYFITKTALLG